jgi:hypothetical protein
MTIKKKKKVDFSVRPRAAKEPLPETPDQWVRAGKGADAGPHKRLTLNLPAALHTAFKVRCAVEDETIQDKVRELIEDWLTVKQPAKEEGGQPL